MCVRRWGLSWGEKNGEDEGRLLCSRYEKKVIAPKMIKFGKDKSLSQSWKLMWQQCCYDSDLFSQLQNPPMTPSVDAQQWAGSRLGSQPRHLQDWKRDWGIRNMK